MNAILKTKLKEFNKTYEKMTKPRKKLFLGSLFIGISVLMMGTMMFPSLDKYKEAKESSEEVIKERDRLVKAKEAALLQKAYRSEKSLLKQKTDLLVEIDKMLKDNKNSNYIPPEDVPKLIENIIKNINQVKIVSLKNNPNISSSSDNAENSNSNILIKHNFNIKVSGSFQGIYDVLSNLEEIKGINMTLVDIEKLDTGLEATFNIYVMNTNKDILNF